MNREQHRHLNERIHTVSREHRYDAPVPAKPDAVAKAERVVAAHEARVQRLHKAHRAETMPILVAKVACEMADALLNALSGTSADAFGTSAGADAIAAERRRQREREGWSPEHDDDHDSADMTQAALVYAGHAVFQIRGQPYAPARRPTGEPIAWPWRPEDYKPKDARRNLVRAGALIAAEIDRLDRAAALSQCTNQGEGR